MADSIVADQWSEVLPPPGVTKNVRWYSDQYVGSEQALLSAGFITPEQLKPQLGRPLGRTAFLPDGSVCPPRVKAWREPGFVSIQRQKDGLYCVELTVSKAEQKARRDNRSAAELEEKQARIDKTIAKDGHLYVNWQLQRRFSNSCEEWEGTKAQLQAAGLGVGENFPGDPGAPDKLMARCPLGFEFRITLPSWNEAKAAARIYSAVSPYRPQLSSHRLAKQVADFAPGVKVEVWTVDDGSTWFDYFTGTAEALVAAGLVPSMNMFPGSLGANRVQASYLPNGDPVSNSPSRNRSMTIRKKGRHQYLVEKAVCDEERARRDGARDEAIKARDRLDQAAGAERCQLRAGVTPLQTAAQFRRDCLIRSAGILHAFWELSQRAQGGWRLNILKGSDLYDEVANAIETIDKAIQTAGVIRDPKLAQASSERLKLAAARNDKGLQSVLRSASHLRLVRGQPDQQ